MNSGIRRVGTLVIVMFLALAAQLTYLQVVRSDRLAADPRNTRKFEATLRRDRGPIVTADGVVVAETKPSNDEFKKQRVYPALTAELYAQVVGYQSVQVGSTGVEATFNDDLAGKTFKLQTSNLSDIFATRQPVGTVVLTLENPAQATAAQALAGRQGSVVVLDVQTGAVIAAYSNPTYDPNLLVSHNLKKAQGAKVLMLLDKSKPLLPRAWAETFPPGSTYKTVTASIALQNNVDVDKVFPTVTEIPLPLTGGQTLKNFGGEACGGTLLESFTVSCNTTFGQVGQDLGELLATGSQQFGVQTAPPPSGGDTGIDPPIAKSSGPIPGTFKTHVPDFMKDAIGQQDVRVTPMQMALVAEAVATGGTIWAPHFVDCVKDPNDKVVRRIAPRAYKQAMDSATAATMKQFMLSVVQQGTGVEAQIPGVQVAGKTGTAETGDGKPPHAWFIAFAPADAPRYAVAVLVEHGGQDGTNAEATGGKVAAPIAKQILQTLLTTPPPAPQCGAGQPSTPTSGG